MAKAKKQAKTVTKGKAKPAAKAVKASPKAKPVAKSKAAPAKAPVKQKSVSEKIINKVIKESKFAVAAVNKTVNKTLKKATEDVISTVEKAAKTLKKEVKANLENENSEEVVAVEAPEKAAKKTKISASQMEALNDDPVEMAKKWHELKKKHGGEKVMNYAMTQAYEAQQPLNHKIFGWGYILKSENDRLEVLFEGGLKSLISNFKKT